MSTLLKKFTLSFLSFVILFGALAPNLLTIKAQNTTPASTGSWYDQNYFDWFQKVYDKNNSSDIFGERYTAAQVQWIFYSIVSLLIPNKDFINCAANGDVSTCTNLIRTVTFDNTPSQNQSLLSLVFNPERSFSLVSYTKNRLEKLSFVAPVHAQSAGFGFQAFDVIQKFWTSIRNISYGLFVIMAVVLAFMIMFRVKISPQVVISVQSAIPKLISAIILITFSYAIAGFVVDLMYVLLGIISVAMANSGDFFASNPVSIFKFLTTGYVGINSSIGIPVGIFGTFIIYIFYFTFDLFFALTKGLTSMGTANFGMVIGIIAFCVLLVVLIWNLFKIIWMLIKAFAQLLLTVVFGPFQIALGIVIPNMGFGSWLKSLIANLAVFPLTGVLLAMSFVFLNLSTSAVNNAVAKSSLWDTLGILGPGVSAIINQFTFNGWPPLLTGSKDVVGLLFLGVSLILITLIPKSVEVIQGFITGKPFAYGTAIGESITPLDQFAQYNASKIYNNGGVLPEWLANLIPGDEKPNASTLKAISETFLNWRKNQGR